MGAAGVRELAGAWKRDRDVAGLPGLQFSLARDVQSDDPEIVLHRGILVVPDHEMDALSGLECERRIGSVERIIAHAHDDGAIRPRGRLGAPCDECERRAGHGEDEERGNESAFHGRPSGMKMLAMSNSILAYPTCQRRCPPSPRP